MFLLYPEFKVASCFCSGHHVNLITTRGISEDLNFI